MTPIQQNQYSHESHRPPSQGRQNRLDLHPFLPVYEASSFPCVFFRNPCQEEPRQRDRPHLEADEHFLSGGSTGHSGRPTSPPTNEDDERRKNYTTRESDAPQSGSFNWVSSKMKLVRKMSKPDRITNDDPREAHDQQQQSSSENNSSSKNSQLSPSSTGTIRVCSDCNTTKTPLWRSGPRGPKSLCNACGIRQRKARRAMAVAAGLIPAVGPRKMRITDGERTMPFKKRCKFTSAHQTPKKLHFDDFVALNLSKNSALQRVFHQDEKEGAILLMALSCGLIRS